MKTYKLFFAFVMIGVVTTVVSFQTLHFVEEQCDQKHYCHETDEADSDATEGFFEYEKECPLCELKLPLIAPDEPKPEDQAELHENCPHEFHYTQPSTDKRPEINHLRGPPSSS